MIPSRNVVVSPGLKSICPMKYNTLKQGKNPYQRCYFSLARIPHVYSLSLRFFLVSGLKNDKYTSSELNCSRANRPSGESA